MTATSHYSPLHSQLAMASLSLTDIHWVLACVLALAASAFAQPSMAQSAAPAANTKPVTLARTDIAQAGAQQAISAALAEAGRNGWVIAVAVVDSGGELVAFQKADGAIGISPAVAIGKARTAALLRQPSKSFEDFINSGRPSFLSTPGTTPLEGGVPITINGQVVGAVGVSGAHGPNDSQAAQAGANAVK
ncbi:heme-binding protein [Zoogloea sp.]|uniref:GlcG/HbpS family heme-binding protein n=1 Tax=Zoogloea sp. TaxID=49181 RepID=UPI0025FB8C29|nr:heme-binding protein [Zoogloea sp.]